MHTYHQLLGLDLPLLEPRIRDLLISLSEVFDELGALRLGGVEVLRRDFVVPDVDATIASRVSSAAPRTQRGDRASSYPFSPSLYIAFILTRSMTL